MIRKGSNQAGGSALTGDWKPMEAAAQPEPTPPAPTPAPQPEPAVSRSVKMHASITCGILRQLACVHVPIALYSICATLAASVNLHCGADMQRYRWLLVKLSITKMYFMYCPVDFVQ